MADSNPMERNAPLCNKLKEKISEINKSKIDQISGKNRSTPQVICIGPYCRDKLGSRCFQEMEELKLRCLAYSLNKSNKNLEEYVEKIWALEEEAKECYSEPLGLQTDDFLEMMLLDGCFIVEFILFSNSIHRKEKSEPPVVRRHPLAGMGRAKLQKICADLLMLHNQIPYKVLNQVFEVSKIDLVSEPLTLVALCVEFFPAILGFPHFRNFPEVEWMHLLHLVWSTFIPSDKPRAKETPGEIRIPLEFQWKPYDLIPCITRLRRVGIKVEPHQKGDLAVNFRRGVIEMPKIILNDLMCSFLENCVTLEQRHNDRSKHFSVYALFLESLVETASDIEYLRKHQVIENHLKTDEEAANFFNDLGKGLTFGWDYGDFLMSCKNINDYSKKAYLWQRIIFEIVYFVHRWWFIPGLISGSVAFALLFLPAFYTVYANYVPPKN